MSNSDIVIQIQDYGDVFGRVIQDPRGVLAHWKKQCAHTETRTAGGRSRIQRDGDGAGHSIEQDSLEGWKHVLPEDDSDGLGSWIPVGIVSAMSSSQHVLLTMGEKWGHPETLIHPALNEDTQLDYNILDCALEHDPEGTLRKYQLDMVRQAFAAPWGRSILMAACGSGKTWVAGTIMILGRLLLGGRWVYLVPNKELARQTASKFTQDIYPKIRHVIHPELATMEYSRLRDDTSRWAIFSSFGCAEAAIAASVATGRSAFSARGLIVDESHTLGSDTRLEIVKRLTAPMRVGLSATPDARQDGRNMIAVGLLGKIVQMRSTGIPSLTEKRYLAPGHVLS